MTSNPVYASGFSLDRTTAIWLPTAEVAVEAGDNTNLQAPLLQDGPAAAEIPEQRDPPAPGDEPAGNSTKFEEDKPRRPPFVAQLQRGLRRVRPRSRDRRSRTPPRQSRHRAAAGTDRAPSEISRARAENTDRIIEPPLPVTRAGQHYALPTPSRRPVAMSVKPKSYLIKRAGVQVAYLASIGMSGYGQTMFFAGWMQIPAELTSMWKAAIGAVFLELVMIGSDGYSMYLRQQTPFRGWQTLRLIGWGACMVGAALQVAHFHGQVGVMFALATIFGFVLQDVSGHRKVVAYLEATGQLTPPPQIGLRRWLLYRGDAYTVWKRLVADPALDVDAEFRTILALRETRKADRKAAARRREALRMAEAQQKTAEAQLATVQAQMTSTSSLPEQAEKQPAKGKRQAPTKSTDGAVSPTPDVAKRQPPVDLVKLVPLALEAERQEERRLGYRKVRDRFKLSDLAGRQLRDLMDEELARRESGSVAG